MAEKKEKPQGQLSLQEAKEALNKKYGAGTVIALDDKVNGNHQIIPSGSIVLDYLVLGVGGWIRGRMYEIRGWEGVGKSTVCGHAVAEAQKAYPEDTVLYVDGEFALDTEYFKSLGVDTNKLLIVQPSNGEEGFEIAKELINTGKISLCIIDSDSSLLPKSVIDGDIGASNIGKKAALNSSVYPKLKKALAINNTCVIVVSQYRQKIGVMFGDPKITQGGMALGFYADAVGEITKKLIKEGDETQGHITTVKFMKNKTYSPHISGSFNVYFGVGIDRIGEVIDKADELEVLRRWGKTITYKGEKYETDAFPEMLETNPEFFEALRAEVITKLKPVGDGTERGTGAESEESTGGEPNPS